MSVPPALAPPQAARRRRRQNDAEKPARSYGVYAQGAVNGLFLGMLINFGNIGPSSGLPQGYSAGHGDHFVLSPVGLHWADESRFAGDWFMEAAPQPHWFFDVLTFVGAATDTLPLTYLLFWISGLAAFGLAAAFLSRKWAPMTPWLFGMTTTVVAALTPWLAVGTGTAMISMALPAVVSANLVFLFMAAALTGRTKWMLGAALATAVVHVQQGAVVVILLAVLAGWQFLASRKVPKATLLSLAAAVSVVATTLLARPVAANGDDFIEICNTIIPYHCAAQQWSTPTVISAITIIVLAICTVLYHSNCDRLVWSAVVGLPMAGLLLGLLANVMSVPFFGTAAQSLNVYRLGALVLPFAVMGMLLPLFRLSRKDVASAALVLVLAWIYLLAGSWQLERPLSPGFIGSYMVIVLAPLVARMTVPGVKPYLQRAGALALILLFLGNALIAGKITPRLLEPGIMSGSASMEWGQAVEEAVPAGESLLASPRARYVRATTYRGVIADCKNIPYGGEAWTQWQERIGDLGGREQCTPGAPDRASYFNSLTAEELDRAAMKYGVRYAVLEGAQADVLPGLEELGWRVVLEPVNSVNNLLLLKAD